MILQIYAIYIFIIPVCPAHCPYTPVHPVYPDCSQTSNPNNVSTIQIMCDAGYSPEGCHLGHFVRITIIQFLATIYNVQSLVVDQKLNCASLMYSMVIIALPMPLYVSENAKHNGVVLPKH